MVQFAGVIRFPSPVAWFYLASAHLAYVEGGGSLSGCNGLRAAGCQFTGRGKLLSSAAEMMTRDRPCRYATGSGLDEMQAVLGLQRQGQARQGFNLLTLLPKGSP